LRDDLLAHAATLDAEVVHADAYGRRWVGPCRSLPSGSYL
jgi:hypothetical protein